jgi:apolipoprotein N-acyltransferase
MTQASFDGPTTTRRSMSVACVLVSAGAYALSGTALDLWPLAWVAPLPILWLALRVTGREATAAAFIAYALGRVGSVPAELAVVPAGVVVGTTVAAATAFAAMIWAARAVAQHLDLRLYALAFPLFWTSWERLVVLPIGSASELGFSQADVLPLVQLVSLTGVVGVSFIVTFAAALTATVLALRERRQAWRGVAIGGIGVVLGVMVFGALRLAWATEGEPVRVGVAASDELIERFRTEHVEEALEATDAYLRRTKELARRGAQVVVLPEKFVGVRPDYSAAVDERFARAAAEDGVWLVAGVNRMGPPAPRNAAAVFAPDGRKVLEYDKVHLVPGYEDEYISGDALGMLPTAPGRWAVAVCRDLVVPELGRRLSRAGARLVLAPAWDFTADGPLESRVARVRAVEGGFSLVRPAKQGVVTVSDAYGRARLAVPTSGTSEVLAVVPIAPGPGTTLYARAGDWFGLACVSGAALLLTALAVSMARSRARTASSAEPASS